VPVEQHYYQPTGCTSGRCSSVLLGNPVVQHQTRLEPDCVDIDDHIANCVHCRRKWVLRRTRSVSPEPVREHRAVSGTFWPTFDGKDLLLVICGSGFALLLLHTLLSSSNKKQE
jgi:hypothetical protein